MSKTRNTYYRSDRFESYTGRLRGCGLDEGQIGELFTIQDGDIIFLLLNEGKSTKEIEKLLKLEEAALEKRIVRIKEITGKKPETPEHALAPAEPYVAKPSAMALTKVEGLPAIPAPRIFKKVAQKPVVKHASAKAARIKQDAVKLPIELYRRLSPAGQYIVELAVQGKSDLEISAKVQIHFIDVDFEELNKLLKSIPAHFGVGSLRQLQNFSDLAAHVRKKAQENSAPTSEIS